MRIVFWLNNLSIHQMPYIVKMVDDERVEELIVVAEREISEQRKKLGWDPYSIKGIDKVNIFLYPSEDIIENILSKNPEKSWHLFSGIRAFPYVFDIFKRSLNYSIKRAIIQERPNTFAFGCANGKPLWLHKIRFYFQDRKFAKHVDCAFAMGGEAVDYLNSVYSWKVYPFCYCTEYKDLQYSLTISTDEPLRLCYVGGLSWWKNVKIILEADYALSLDEQNDIRIVIMGDGPDRQMLEDYVRNKNLKNVDFMGVVPNSKIVKEFEEQDVLILPSVYDGWGAVVNEALLAGLYVICSDAAGASDALSNNSNGIVFHRRNMAELLSALKKIISERNGIRFNRKRRQDWAVDSLGGKAVATYMVDCLSGKDVKRPWII
ncbi:MAG: glycosyltransferase [Bacteroidales bacterium]|nr:glycosyltransferase [Bacteroidales bacterium]